MMTRRRSIIIAVLATLFGLALFLYDDFLDKTDLDGNALHLLTKSLEFILQGPGMGVLAFALCEYMRLTEERLRNERDRARQERFVVLGQIAASIAHEVRNPLHNVQLLMDEQNQENDDDPARTRVRVQANLDRINRAVEMVYQLARPDNQRQDEDIGIDLNSVITDAVASLGKDSKQQFNCSLPDSPAAVACPPTTIRIAIDNLLRNALNSGSQTIDVVVTPLAGRWQIVISNHGRLPDEVLQGNKDAPQTSSATGLGLGIFITRQLLRGCTGELTLEQRGDTVAATLSLPMWSSTA